MSEATAKSSGGAAKKRPRGRAFAKGQSGNPAGRRKGACNKATREIKEIAQRLLSDPAYQKSLERRLKKGTAGQMEVLLHHYGYGKPKETVEGTGVVTLRVVYEEEEPRTGDVS